MCKYVYHNSIRRCLRQVLQYEEDSPAISICKINEIEVSYIILNGHAGVQIRNQGYLSRLRSVSNGANKRTCIDLEQFLNIDSHVIASSPPRINAAKISPILQPLDRPASNPTVSSCGTLFHIHVGSTLPFCTTADQLGGGCRHSASRGRGEVGVRLASSKSTNYNGIAESAVVVDDET